MVLENLRRLQYICDITPGLLAEIDEESFSLKPGIDKWSKKDILGHLIDSATNNHHRWVRAQFETSPSISYDQNKWNEFSHYNSIESMQLVKFWTLYNLQIFNLIKFIPENNLQRLYNTGDKLVTLEWLFNDYLDHLEHHLHQIIDYQNEY